MNVKWLNYHHLIYFFEIAKQKSISKAAEVLNVGQPALSSQLKNLEEYLGVKLFERKNRRLYLTEHGKITFEYAKKISHLGQELLEVIDLKEMTQKAHLTVGALDSIPKSLITNIVDFAHKKTGCFLSIFENNLSELIERLLSHQIDIIITDKQVHYSKNKNIVSKKILTLPLEAYGAPELIHLKKKFPKSLDGVNCIVPTADTNIRNKIEHYFHLNKIKPHYAAETQDTALQKTLAVKGDGVVFLPRFTTKFYVEKKQLVRLGELKNTLVSYYLIYSKRAIDNPALKLILNQDFSKKRLS